MNSGKSSLVNALTGQDTAIVSEVAGTTTDAVMKSMELHGVGAVTFIDTAGFGDGSELGRARLGKTRDAALKTDIAVIVFTAEGMADDYSSEVRWMRDFSGRGVPVIAVLNKSDLLEDTAPVAGHIEITAGHRPLVVSARDREGLGAPKGAIAVSAGGAAQPTAINGHPLHPRALGLRRIPPCPPSPQRPLESPPRPTHPRPPGQTTHN